MEEIARFSGLHDHSCCPQAAGELGHIPTSAGASWESIVTDNYSHVFQLAVKLTGDRHDAADLTHDVFLRVHQSLHSFKPGNLNGWLYRITTNLFLDQRRKAARRNDVQLDNMETLPQAISVEKLPDEVLVASQIDPDLKHALDELSPTSRAAVVLFDVQGFSYDEISSALGLKLGTVRSRIHRARKQMRSSLIAAGSWLADGGRSGVFA